MKFALTLSVYISRQFVFFFLMTLSIFAILIFMMDSVEMLRKASALQIPMFIMADMVLLKLPMLLQVILPFIILVSSVLTYTSMARRSELVIIRSAGVSVWEFLMPSVITAFMIGIFTASVINPISALMLNKYEHLNAKYFENKQNLLDISETGLWLRQKYEIFPQVKDAKENLNELVFHAKEVTGNNNISLIDIEIYAFDYQDNFIYRIDAPVAHLKENQLLIESALVTFRNNKNNKVAAFSIETNLKPSDVQNSFADPQAISFFELPFFIRKLESSGFSALPHILQWHKILSSPFFFAAMVLIGAIFSLKAPRQGSIGYAISVSILFGFVIYFLSNLISSIGLAGSMPVAVAAWTPVVITGFMGVALLLHYEDG
jgi:lipopolysaccharide export system permease protein